MADAISLDAFWTNGNPIIQAAIAGPFWVAVRGAYTGNAPLGVQFQISVFPLGTVLLAWTSLSGVTINNGKWEGWIGYQPTTFGSGFLTLQVRYLNETSVVATSSAFAIGDIFLLTGQSNQERFAGVSSGTVTAPCAVSIYFSDPAEATSFGITGNAPEWITLNVCVGGQPDGLANLATRITAITGRAVGFIFLARGGIPLVKNSVAAANPFAYLLSKEGNPAFSLEALLTRSLLALEDASISKLGVDFAGIFHIHGEADGGAGIPTDIYLRGLAHYYEILRTRTGRRPQDCPMFVTPVGKNGSAPCTLVRRAMVQAAQIPGIIISADHYHLPIDNSDTLGVHLSTAGLASLGNLLGADAAHYYAPTTVTAPGAGPFVQSAARVAAGTVTFSIHLNGHSGVALQNGAAAATGFVLTGATGANATITNATLSGTQGTISYSGSPTLPLALDYQPSIYGATDNLIVTTDHPAGESAGVPLQSMAMPLNVFEPTTPALPTPYAAPSQL